VSEHVFVDETKDRGFVMAAAALPAACLNDARKAIRGLVMPGQRRIHFHKESDARRKQILDVIEAIPLRVVFYDATRLPRNRQRDACLRSITQDMALEGAQMLVIERDESVLDADRRLLYRCFRELECPWSVQYRFPRAHEEPLLTIPDAFAWCFNRGGHWRKRALAAARCVRVS
jgi:hypothetical protein